MKNTKRNTIILLIICVIVLYFVVKDDFADIVDNLLLANKWLILLREKDIKIKPIDVRKKLIKLRWR